MACKSILTGETSSTRTFVRLVARMNLCMALEVVLANETFTAAIASELSVSKVCLHMRPDVLSSSKHLATVWIHASPLSGGCVLLADVALYLFWRDTSIF
jgi:hypothetical protein